MYLILGCLMDGLSLVVLTIPFTYPVMMELGFDGIWFGIVVTLLVETVVITSPIGANLFVVQGLTGHRFSDITFGSLPFAILLVLGIVIITAFPQIALWLPSLMN